jgi:hypothetical protein
MLPISSLVNLWHRDTCIAAGGRATQDRQARRAQLWPKEVSGLQQSAKTLQDTLAKVKA